jgi:hypothetical protein
VGALQSCRRSIKIISCHKPFRIVVGSTSNSGWDGDETAVSFKMSLSFYQSAKNDANQEKIACDQEGGRVFQARIERASQTLHLLIITTLEGSGVG